MNQQPADEADSSDDVLLGRLENIDLVELAARLSASSFAAVWDNREDDVYNELPAPAC
jgi:hypothetical protein